MPRTPVASLLFVALGCSSTTVTLDAAPGSDAARDGADVADAAMGCTAPAPTDPVVAQTDRGLVRGAMDGESLRWLGIPYAQPPVGALRWRPPADLTACWTDPRPATEWAPSCPQIPQSQTMPFDPMAPMQGQEDCLTLNVWRPANVPAGTTLPIMVFIHGGGNVVGSAGETSPSGMRTYDASRLASRGNVVVVTLQYRIGPLGWLAHPALEAEPGGSLNLAMLDQIAALRWVQRNAGAFRGDPARVMVFGESAGAVNTCALVASPLAAGLFSRAAIESGSCLSTQTTEVARAQGARFATATQCAAAPDPARCMRDLSVDAVLRALPAPVTISGLDAAMTARWGPVVAGPTLPERPYDAMLAGRQNRVPLIVGHNSEEVGLTVPSIPTEAAYRQALTNLGGAMLAQSVLAAYPVARYGTPRNALVQALTDARFGCQARAAARAHLRGGAAVWRYLFAQPYESGSPTLRALGAWHGVELAYVFQNIGRAPMPAANDLTVERAVLGYWTRFAATGNPGAADAWPPYGAGEPLLRIEPMERVERGWRNAECDGWDRISQVMPPAP
jgi:para-nitrobenzyl esterase